MTELEKDGGELDAAAAFDTIYTTNHIRILKTLLPFFGTREKNGLAVLIRYLELQYTMQYAASHPLSVCGEGPEKKKLDFPLFYQSIKGLLDERERNMFEKILQMQNTMKNVQEMMQMMELMKELNPEMFSSGPDASGQESGGSASGKEGREEPGFGPQDGSREDAAGGSFFGGMNPMELLKGMLSPEQAAMFEMFQGDK